MSQSRNVYLKMKTLPEARKIVEDAALILASYEMQVSMVFIGDGVYQTLATQEPELVNHKDFVATFKALSFYDIDDIYISKSCVEQRHINHDSVFDTPQYVSFGQISNLIANADHVLSF